MDDANLIHVRARFEGDLERLCERFNIEPAILETPSNDYRWRMNFTREQWSDIMAEEAKDIDYCNFKNAVHDGTGRDRAYMDVWGIMSRAQYDQQR